MIKFLTTFSLVCFVLQVFAQNTMVHTSSDRYYKKGLDLLEKEKYGASIKFLEKYIEESPESINVVDAQFAIVFAEMQLEQKHASKHLNDFIEENPGHPKSEIAHYEAGINNFKKKKYKQTIEHLSLVSKSKLDEALLLEYNFALGYSYFLQKEYKKSLKYFEALHRKENKYKSAAMYYAGYVYFKEEKYEKSIEIFKGLEDSKTYGAVVPFMITNIMYHQGKYNEVVDYGTQMMESKRKLSNKNEIILLVGTSHFELKNYTETIKYLKPYVKAKGGSNSTKYRLAYSCFVTDIINSFLIKKHAFKPLKIYQTTKTIQTTINQFKPL